MPSFWNTDNMFVYNDVVDAAGNIVCKKLIIMVNVGI